MQENYINIYSRYLAELGRTQQAHLRRIYEMMQIFVPFLHSVQSRQDLIAFIDSHTGDFPELQELKIRLNDPNYVFPGVEKKE